MILHCALRDRNKRNCDCKIYKILITEQSLCTVGVLLDYRTCCNKLYHIYILNLVSFLVLYHHPTCSFESLLKP